MDLQLVYLSSAREALSDDGLTNILIVSRRNNRRRGITGALIYAEQRFLQILEGPMAAVDDLFERIRTDPRHSDVTIVTRGSVERRAFPDWAMGFVTPDEAVQRTPGYSLLRAMPDRAGNARDIRDLIELFNLGKVDAVADSKSNAR